METKKEIRRALLKRRDELPQMQWDAFSNSIMDKVICHSLFQRTETIYCYMSYHHEVDTRNLISYALNIGKKVAIPKVLGREMEFYYIRSLQDVQPGSKGILEPKGEHGQLANEERALMLMPLVGYDAHNNRLGYGGGYYDRYLQKHPEHHTMGLAFTLQKVTEIPVEETDWKLDIIITEEKGV